MSEIFTNIPQIKYEGKDSKNPFAFKFYDAEKVVLGKKMKEHLPFAMAWWHNLCAAGTDMFGRDTADKSFGAQKGTMEHAKAKVDAGFEFMQKLGIEYFCFHDVDLVPEAEDIKETNRRLDEISDYILEKMKGTNIKCLWGTANMFSNPRFMNGAGSTNSAEVYCFAAAQIKKALDLTVKLGGRGYVFWGGREGYETLLNTDMKFEQENIARLMKMAVEYGRSIGFTGDFYIEPKPISANYSIGDKIPIFYDPQNPEIIASPRSQSVGIFWLIFALLFLALVLFALLFVIKSRRKFLVTQEEYDKEGEELKRSKLAEKKQKKRAKLERKNRHPKIRKIGRIILIVLGCLIGAFVLYLLFGLLLISIGY